MANFLEGIATVRQLSFGMLDMAWHSGNPSTVGDVKEFETAAFAKTRLLPEHAETCMSTSFSHIFQGGYSAGYYSYKWAEVLDADAFSYFREKGIFNKEVAGKFKENILSKGGTEDPMDLYVRPAGTGRPGRCQVLNSVRRVNRGALFLLSSKRIPTPGEVYHPVSQRIQDVSRHSTAPTFFAIEVNLSSFGNGIPGVDEVFRHPIDIHRTIEVSFCKFPGGTHINEKVVWPQHFV